MTHSWRLGQKDYGCPIENTAWKLRDMGGIEKIRVNSDNTRSIWTKQCIMNDQLKLNSNITSVHLSQSQTNFHPRFHIFIRKSSNDDQWFCHPTMLNEKVGHGILKVRNKDNKTSPLSTHQNFLSRTALTDANCLIKFEKSMIFASAFSMERMTRSASLDCPMVDRRYVFINFNFENDLSALATVIGIIRNSY